MSATVLLHGAEGPSRAAYQRGCRCAGCRECETQYRRRLRRRQMGVHRQKGTPSANGYRRGCRCAGCRAAITAYNTDRLRARMQAPATSQSRRVSASAVRAAYRVLLAALARTTPVCAEVDPELWFPLSGGQHASAKAVSLCEGCPLLEPCRSYALTHAAGGYRLRGVWGGLTERDRTRITGVHAYRDLEAQAEYCGECGAELIDPDGAGRRARFCSDNCRKVHSARERERRRAEHGRPDRPGRAA